MIDQFDEWFVQVYTNGEFLEDIRQAVNDELIRKGRRPWTDSTIASRASRLRKMGVQLPKKRFREKLSDRTPGVARLNEIIDRVLAGQKVKVNPISPAAPRPIPTVDPREAVRKVILVMANERAQEPLPSNHPPHDD